MDHPIGWETEMRIHAGSRLSRRAFGRCAGAGAIALAVTACTGKTGSATTAPNAAGDVSARFAFFTAADEPNGNLDRVVWPAFVTQAGPDVRRLYEFQVLHGDLMRYMPCFCGCGKNDGHRNNRDCYVKQVNADGSVVFDQMAPT